MAGFLSMQQWVVIFYGGCEAVASSSGVGVLLYFTSMLFIISLLGQTHVAGG